MSDDADVIVVGGGAMGSAAAWRLAGRGLDVVLLERFEPGHVRGSSHGASRVFRLAYPDADYVALARRALPLWRELEAAAGVELLTTTGGVDHGPDATVGPIVAALTALGVRFEQLTPAAAAERWPGLAFDQRVVHQAEAGRVHADATVAALQRAAVALGADVRHRTPVRRLRARAAGGVEVDTDDGTLRAAGAVVALGAWTSPLLDGLVDLPRLVVTAEQPAHFTPYDPAIPWPSFLHYPSRASPAGWGAYGLFTPGEGVKVGVHGTGVVSDPDRRSFAPDPAGERVLREYVARWLPGVDPDSALPMSCLYTSTANEDFVLDRRGPLSVAAGFSGHGFKFVPAIGEILADLATGAAPAPARFSLADRRPGGGGRRAGAHF